MRRIGRMQFAKPKHDALKQDEIFRSKSRAMCSLRLAYAATRASFARCVRSSRTDFCHNRAVAALMRAMSVQMRAAAARKSKFAR